MLDKSKTVKCLPVLVFILSAVACSAQSPSASSAPFPTGTFWTNDPQWGEFVAEFKGDGIFTITKPYGYRQAAGQLPQGISQSIGSYTVTGNQIVIKLGFCTEAGKTDGTYVWRFDGSKLTFDAVQDICADRWRIFNAIWTKR